MKIFTIVTLTLAWLPASSPAEQPPEIGKLIIAGGGVYSAREEIWTALLDAHFPNKPIGIVATAGSDSMQLAINTAEFRRPFQANLTDRDLAASKRNRGHSPHHHDLVYPHRGDNSWKKTSVSPE